MFSKVYCFLAHTLHSLCWLITKLKHRVNSQTISSYLIRFSTDIVNNKAFFLLFFFGFIFFYFFSFFCFLFLFFLFETKNYILCGWVSDEKISTWPISRKKTNFFCLNEKAKNVMWEYNKTHS